MPLKGQRLSEAQKAALRNAKLDAALSYDRD